MGHGASLGLLHFRIRRVDQTAKPLCPAGEGVTFLRIIAVAVIDGGNAGFDVVEDLGDYKAGDAEAGHMARNRAPQVVGGEVGDPQGFYVSIYGACEGSHGDGAVAPRGWKKVTHL